MGGSPVQPKAGISFDDLIGVPFKKGGRTADEGLDCWGLVIEVFRRFGIIVPDYADELKNGTDLLTFATKQREYWETVPRNCEDRPLLTVIRNDPKLYNHTGVVVPGNRMLHSIEKAGVVSHNWRKEVPRLGGVYRWIA